MSRRLLVVVSMMVLGALFAAPAAQAEFGIAAWQGLTCKENLDTPGLAEPPVSGLAPLPQSPGQCTKSTSEKWFTQAGGHPNFGLTDFTLNTYPGALPIGGFPEGFVKDIVVDTPEGLSVNPEALPQCKVSELDTASCPPTSLVGVNYLTVAAGSPAEEPPCKGLPSCPQARVALPVYNLVPFEGVPSMVGFLTESGPTFIVGSLDPVDQHVTFTISNINPPAPTSPPIIGSRLVFNGVAGDGTYLTMPSNCGSGQISTLHVDQQTAPGTYVSQSATTPYGATGCEKVPFKPTINVSTNGGAVDSPEPTNVDVGIPWKASDPIANSYLKTAKVTLPEGMGINPSGANGLAACTAAQFAKGTNNPVTCPEASKIGTVEVQTPALPANTIGGTVYVGEPKNNNPSSGEQFRIFIYANAPQRGVNIRLVGKVFPNLKTGQLTAVVEENPQATFTHFVLHMSGGAKGILTSPGTCGPNKTTTEMTPWSGHADENTPSNSFNLTSYPGGGSCPKTLAERPFAPSYTATPDSPKAGAYSPLRFHISRPDGQQELKVINATLPRGVMGNLSGIPYCSDAALASAAASSGKAQEANSSCPAASMIGTTEVAAGSGPQPFKIKGKIFLAGPYKGAPLSMAIVDPSVAGPYDIGTVVVRAALYVNPETAQINAVSDPIPNVFGGVKLDIRTVNLNLDRSNFTLNSTNCEPQATAGTLSGGGADPSNPAVFSSYPFSAPYQATECNKLGFKPKLFTRLFGSDIKRNGNPRIRAILEARKGDANIARTALTLPHAIFLDQSHIRTICTRPQLASQTCPKAAVYGHAEASSPLLENKLKGPVYLVSSTHTLPDLVADLRGQVNIQLHGVISSKRGGIKTVFNPVPDVAVSKFILNMEGGKKSLLVNSQDLCKSKLNSVLNIKGQNDKQVKTNKLPLKVSACDNKKKK